MGNAFGMVAGSLSGEQAGGRKIRNKNKAEKTFVTIAR
jgi:hypothetical protein